MITNYEPVVFGDLFLNYVVFCYYCEILRFCQ
jgi:hypothetical protein